MRILLVHNKYRLPGGEDAVFAAERAMLQSAGHDVQTYVRENDEIQDNGLISKIELAMKTVWSWDTYRELKAILNREKPAVVHFHNTFPQVSPAAYDACRAEGIPVIQTLHNYRLLCPGATFYRQEKFCDDCVQHSLLRSVRHACYRDSRMTTAATAMMLAVHRLRKTYVDRVDTYIALTHFGRRTFVENGLPDAKVVVKPNFLQRDPGHKSGTGEHALFVGRLSPEKGLRTLLSAWKQIKNIPLLILGDGPLRAELESEATKYQLTNVVFRGHVSKEETLTAIRNARFLVFPSEWPEGFPMTLVETFACGTPVIYSGIGALPEIVENGKTGVQFKCGDGASLVDAVNWAWNRPAAMAEMGNAARLEFTSKYTAERNYRLLMEIYRGAMAGSEELAESQPVAMA